MTVVVVDHAHHLRRSDWSVTTLEQAEARALIERWHYAQGCPNTSVARHGLIGQSGEAAGVAMWLPPTPTAARSAARHFDMEDQWRGVLSLTRLVVAPKAPTNAASFLLGSSMRLVDRARWPILLTYADTSQGHTGAIYRATNWAYLGLVPAGDTWINAKGEQRGRKRGKRNLSVAEMTEAGFTRRPALPKHKFAHLA